MANLGKWWSSYCYGEILNFIAIGPDDLYTSQEIEVMLKKYILKQSETDSSDQVPYSLSEIQEEIFNEDD